jgi:hypothetical protein
MNPQPGRIRYFFIPLIASMMAILGVTMIDFFYDTKLGLKFPAMCIVSTIVWLILSPLLRGGPFWRALLLGVLSPFVGSLFIPPPVISLLFLAPYWLAVIPTGLVTATLCWLILNIPIREQA